MATINFKQPKFILPLILFPFLLLGFFVYSGFKSKGNKGKMRLEDSLALIQQKGFNMEMPGVSKEIRDGAVKDKFSAYQEAYKNEKDFSALNTLGEITGTDENKIGSAYNSSDLQKLNSDRKLDSIRKVLEQRRILIEQRMGALTIPGSSGGKRSSSYSPPSDRQQELLAALKLQSQNAYGNTYANEQSTVNPRKPAASSYEEQMKLFKEQMKMVDSMQKMNAPKKITEQEDGFGEIVKNKFDPAKDTSFKPLHVSSAGNPRYADAFNTVKKFSSEAQISAIIDESKKVTAGGRVRIKLLQDIYVGENLLPAGTFLYGLVTGFQTQRVNISITSINNGGTPLPVKLDLYDNDGYLGLYVPGSNFREFTKEIGTQSTQGLSSIQSASGSTDVTTSIISKLFATGTNTVGKIIAQNKAELKSDYIVFLKENKSNK
jgi:conjugative transposon TraM protein